MKSYLFQLEEVRAIQATKDKERRRRKDAKVFLR